MPSYGLEPRASGRGFRGTNATVVDTTGAADAGRIVTLGTDGLLDNTVLPARADYLFPYLKAAGGTVHADILAALSAGRLAVGDIIQTASYWQNGQIGGATYQVVAAATGTDDGGAFINAGALQLRAAFNGVVDVAQFGAKGDGSEAAAVIQAAVSWAFAASIGIVEIPTGTYLISTTVAVSETMRLIGKASSEIGPAAPRVQFTVPAGFSSVVINQTGFGGELQDIIIDLTGAAAGAIGVRAQAVYKNRWRRLAVSNIPSGCIGFAIVATNATGCYWGTYENCQAGGSEALPINAKVGTGWFISDNAGHTNVVNQQQFRLCQAFYLDVGFDIVSPGAGMIFTNCTSEGGNTVTGVALRVTGTFELNYNVIWEGGEINGYATGASGNIWMRNVGNLSPSARENGALGDVVWNGTHEVEYSAARYQELYRRTNGQFSSQVAGQITQRAIVPSGATTEVLRFVGMASGGSVLTSGALTIAAYQPNTTGNRREMYHIGTLADISADILLVNGFASAGGVGGWAVTVTKVGADWVVNVAHTAGIDVNVWAFYSGVVAFG